MWALQSYMHLNVLTAVLYCVRLGMGGFQELMCLDIELLRSLLNITRGIVFLEVL